MTETSKEAIVSYFDDLLGEPAAPTTEESAAKPLTTASPASQARSPTAPEPRKNVAQPLALAQVAQMDADLKALEESKKLQLQALLNSHLLVPTPAPTATPAPTLVDVSTSTAVLTRAPVPIEPVPVSQSSPLTQAVVKDEPMPSAAIDTTAGKAVNPYLAWAENGRPVWAQKQFDVLLFQVAGLTLAVPLIALGQIYPLTDDLTPVFGQIDWFMGFQPTQAGAIRTVNTALFVMPERYDPKFPSTAKYVVTIDGLDWGLAVDAVRNPSTLQPEDVTWRSQRSKRPWLAGTVKSAMCALIDIPQMGQLLQSHDRKRTLSHT